MVANLERLVWRVRILLASGTPPTWVNISRVGYFLRWKCQRSLDLWVCHTQSSVQFKWRFLSHRNLYKRALYLLNFSSLTSLNSIVRQLFTPAFKHSLNTAHNTTDFHVHVMLKMQPRSLQSQRNLAQNSTRRYSPNCHTKPQEILLPWMQL